MKEKYKNISGNWKLNKAEYFYIDKLIVTDFPPKFEGVNTFFPCVVKRLYVHINPNVKESSEKFFYWAFVSENKFISPYENDNNCMPYSNFLCKLGTTHEMVINLKWGAPPPVN